MVYDDFQGSRTGSGEGRVVAFFLYRDYTGPVWRIQSVESIKNRWELVSKASIPASDWSSVLTLQQPQW